jgi:hypothetical protein
MEQLALLVKPPPPTTTATTAIVAAAAAAAAAAATATTGDGGGGKSRWGGRLNCRELCGYACGAQHVNQVGRASIHRCCFLVVRRTCKQAQCKQLTAQGNWASK